MQVRADQWQADTNCLTGDGTSGCPGAQTINNVTYSPEYEISELLTDAEDPIGKLRKVKVKISWPST
jgi:hypothetical protein